MLGAAIILSTVVIVAAYWLGMNKGIDIVQKAYKLGRYKE